MRSLAALFALSLLACGTGPQISDPQSVPRAQAPAVRDEAFATQAEVTPAEVQERYAERFAAPDAPVADTGRSVQRALAWLASHQRADGSWPSESDDMNAVGATGLALLAFLGDGHTAREGAHAAVVARGLQWLTDAQDPESGLLGERRGHTFLYCHAIATCALCEASLLSPSSVPEATVQRAVDCILRARNPYGAWRYDMPPSGDNDTSVTGWMVLALCSARDAGSKVDEAAFRGALSWLDSVTDPQTGRTGYDSVGSSSSRIQRVNDQFPSESGEAMTAISLFVRQMLRQSPGSHPLLDRQADLLRAKLPRWDASGAYNDFYYWYFGSYALYQYGGERHWKPWNAALKETLVESQRKDGDEAGSWDPLDPWGLVGGRVYSTALAALSLEVYYRYAKLAR